MLPRYSIVQFNRLRIGHHLLPSHTYKLNLNDSPFCTLHMEECICDLSHILFDCPSLSIKRQNLITSLNSSNISFNFYSILNSNSEPIIIIFISFIQESDFIIWLFLFIYFNLKFLLYITWYYLLFCLFLYWFVNILMYCNCWTRLLLKAKKKVDVQTQTAYKKGLCYNSNTQTSYVSV